MVYAAINRDSVDSKANDHIKISFQGKTRGVGSMPNVLIAFLNRQEAKVYLVVSLGPRIDTRSMA